MHFEPLGKESPCFWKIISKISDTNRPTSVTLAQLEFLATCKNLCMHVLAIL